MPANLRFTKDYFKCITDYEALQDFLQNFADQAFGVDLKLSLHEWQHIFKEQEWKRDTLCKLVCDVGFIEIKPGKFGENYTIIIHNNNVKLSRDAFTEMGYTTKSGKDNMVGCKGIGAKNATAAWVARHGQHSIKMDTDNCRWHPQFTAIGQGFTIPKKAIKNKEVNYFEITIKKVKEVDITRLFETILWLQRPFEGDILFESEKGQLLLPTSQYTKQIFISNNFVTKYDLVFGGINIYPSRRTEIQLTSDRKNIMNSSFDVLQDKIAELWVEAVTSKPNLIEFLYDTCEKSEPCAIEKKILTLLAIQLTDEFKRRHPYRSYPSINQNLSMIKKQLVEFDVIPVNGTLCEIISSQLGSPNDILINELATSQLSILDITSDFMKRFDSIMKSLKSNEQEIKYVQGNLRQPFILLVENLYYVNDGYFTEITKNEEGLEKLVDKITTSIDITLSCKKYAQIIDIIRKPLDNPETCDSDDDMEDDGSDCSSEASFDDDEDDSDAELMKKVSVRSTNPTNMSNQLTSSKKRSIDTSEIWNDMEKAINETMSCFKKYKNHHIQPVKPVDVPSEY